MQVTGQDRRLLLPSVRRFGGESERLGHHNLWSHAEHHGGGLCAVFMTINMDAHNLCPHFVTVHLFFYFLGFRLPAELEKITKRVQRM